eukprot:14837997-Ditylum_brightwellii.AAC.1
MSTSNQPPFQTLEGIMEAVFLLHPSQMVGKSFGVIWYHVTKFVPAKDQIVGSVWNHIGPVVHALSGSLHTSYPIGSVLCLEIREDL